MARNDRKSKLIESVLVARLDPRRIGLSVQRYSWRLLVQDPDGIWCTLALDAMFSQLNPAAPLHDEVCFWIRENRTNRMLLAYLVVRASEGECERDLVLKHAFNGDTSWLPMDVLSLWRRAWDGELIDAEWAFEVLGIRNWKGAPPANRPHLYDAIRRIWLDQGLESREALVDSYWDRRLMVNMPNLAGIVLRSYMLQGNLDQITRLLTELPDAYVMPAADLVTHERMEEVILKPSTNAHRWSDGIFGLTKALVDKLPDLEKEVRAAVVAKLLAARYPWIWAVAPQICAYAQGSVALPEFMADWVIGEGDPNRFSHHEDIARQYGKIPLKGGLHFVHTLEAVGFDAAAVLLRVLDGSDSSTFFFAKQYHEVVKAFVIREDHKDRYKAALAEPIVSGEAEAPLVNFFVLAFTPMDTQEEVRAWLTAETEKGLGDESRVLDIIRLSVIPYELPAGRMLRVGSAGVVWALMSGGYVLRPEDVSSESGVMHIVGAVCGCREVGTDQSRRRSDILWRNRGWADSLLGSGFAGLQLVEDLLRCDADRDQTTYADDILLPNCRAHEQLRRAVYLCAWDQYEVGLKNYALQNQAQRFLTSSEETQGWVRSECFEMAHRGLLDDALYPGTSNGQGTLAALRLFLTPSERASQLLSIPARGTVLLGSPTDLADAFESEEQRDGLASWLCSRFAHIPDHDSFMGWVDYFGLITRPQVRALVRRHILESTRERAVETALRLLTQ